MVPNSTPSDDYDYFDDEPTEDMPASGLGCYANLLTLAAGLLSTSYGITACVLALATAINHRGQASLAAITLKASLWTALRRFAL